MARVTVRVRNVERVVRALVAKEGAILSEARKAVARSGERVYQSALAATPVDTGKMADELKLIMNKTGLGYSCGWHAEDFTGTRPDGRPMEFYPPFVVFGTSKLAGNDPLTPALEADRPILAQEIAEAARAR